MKRSYTKAFERTFDAMQCLAWTVLYYDYDFDDKEKMIAFQKGLTEHNKELDDPEIYKRVIDDLKDMGINCSILANDFPYISKMALSGFDKRKDKAQAMMIGSNKAIEIFLIIYFKELITVWGFTKEQAIESYEKIKENSNLYRQGMTNEFVKGYFKEQIDLDIKL